MCAYVRVFSCARAIYKFGIFTYESERMWNAFDRNRFVSPCAQISQTQKHTAHFCVWRGVGPEDEYHIHDICYFYRLTSSLWAFGFSIRRDWHRSPSASHFFLLLFNISWVWRLIWNSGFIECFSINNIVRWGYFFIITTTRCCC